MLKNRVRRKEDEIYLLSNLMYRNNLTSTLLSASFIYKNISIQFNIIVVKTWTVIIRVIPKEKIYSTVQNAYKRKRFRRFFFFCFFFFVIGFTNLVHI